MLPLGPWDLTPTGLGYRLGAYLVQRGPGNVAQDAQEAAKSTGLAVVKSVQNASAAVGQGIASGAAAVGKGVFGFLDRTILILALVLVGAIFVSKVADKAFE